MVQKSKFLIGYYLVVFLLIMFLQTVFLSGPAVQELPYSKFRDLIKASKVQTVIIEAGKIYGRLKPEQAKTGTKASVSGKSQASASKQKSSAAKSGFIPHRKQTPWYFNLENKIRQSEKDREDEIKRQFTVVPLNDPTLLEDLQRHGVTYSGKIESHFLSHLISNWIIPFVILSVVWGVIMRQVAQRHHAGGTAGNGKDPAGAGRRRRGGGAFFQPQRVGFRRDVRRGGGCPGPRSVQVSQGQGPVYHLH